MLQTPFPRTFGDHNVPTRPYAPECPLDAIDAEQLEEIAPGTFVPAAPAPPAPDALNDNDHDEEEEITFPKRRGYRQDGWTPDRRARFCEMVAEGSTVEAACYGLGMTVSAAYALRRRPDGASFALAWDAANLLARGRIADRLISRAMDGQVERVVRPNGDVVERHRFDNRLALSMLARLDRQAEAAAEKAAPNAAAARLVAQDFDGFLDLLRRDAAPARAGLFLLHAGQTKAADLAPIAALARADQFLRAAPEGKGLPDADHRADWTAEDWRRAEAAGLIAFAPPEPEPEVEARTPHEPQLPPLPPAEPVWWDEDEEAWRTRFPPPENHFGYEDGEYGDEGYERSLTDEEQDALATLRETQVAPQRVRESAERDAWFAMAGSGELQTEDEPAASPTAVTPAPVPGSRVVAGDDLTGEAPEPAPANASASPFALTREDVPRRTLHPGTAAGVTEEASEADHLVWRPA